MTAAASPAEVSRFWLEEVGREGWYKKDDKVDAAIRDRFLPTWEAARKGNLDHWLDAPSSALALVTVLDQFPRNMFRQSAKAYAADAKARAVADIAIARGHDMATALPERVFFYMPLEHSESLADQRRCCELMRERIPDDDFNRFAVLHREIIARFGRFPHRNHVLGRATTEEEQAWLDDGGFKG